MMAGDPTNCQLPSKQKPQFCHWKDAINEAWYKKKPDLSHIHTIGCTAYTKRIVLKHRKLTDKKAFLGKLLAYDGDHIYRLLIQDEQVIRS